MYVLKTEFDKIIKKLKKQVCCARPYKVYAALLTQTGTDDPVITVFENTLGVTPVFERTSTGTYLEVLDFDPAKVYVTTSINTDTTSTSTVFSGVYDDGNGDSEIAISTYQSGVAADIAGNGIFVEIRVYP